MTVKNVRRGRPAGTASGRKFRRIYATDDEIMELRSYLKKLRSMNQVFALDENGLPAQLKMCSDSQIDAFALTPWHAEILKLRRDGEAMQEIGDIKGISRERVRQIISRYDYINIGAERGDEEYLKCSTDPDYLSIGEYAASHGVSYSFVFSKCKNKEIQSTSTAKGKKTVYLIHKDTPCPERAIGRPSTGRKAREYYLTDDEDARVRELIEELRE
jgi:hypothetical protein